MLFRSDRKSTRLNSSHLVISYAVFCLKKKIIPSHERVESSLDERRRVLTFTRTGPGRVVGDSMWRAAICATTWVLVTFFFFFNDTATTEIYTLSLHDALPI